VCFQPSVVLRAAYSCISKQCVCASRKGKVACTIPRAPTMQQCSHCCVQDVTGLHVHHSVCLPLCAHFCAHQSMLCKCLVCVDCLSTHAELVGSACHQMTVGPYSELSYSPEMCICIGDCGWLLPASLRLQQQHCLYITLLVVCLSCLRHCLAFSCPGAMHRALVPAAWHRATDLRTASCCARMLLAWHTCSRCNRG
jgi:hypothetical protein